MSVLSGLRVLDLTCGVAGPMTAMMLGDMGAAVIKIEPPGGAPSRGRLADKAWERGKRSIELDLGDEADRGVFKTLALHADILIEDFQPGRASALGLDYAALHALNPRLIYVSITGYGRDMPESDRPAHDLLVAARTGLSWEHRGWPQTAMVHMMGAEDVLADLEVPYEHVQGPPREGPVATASPAASLGAFYLALTAVHAALYARELTGEGQWVETSLLQGALAAGGGVWQRAERHDRPGFNSWIFGSKGPKGHFQTRDGDWIHNWVPNPRFLIQASEGETINSSPDLSAQNDPDRFGTGVEETFVIAHYHPILAECVRKFTARDWLEAAALADATLQDARSPEAALSDPLLLADGCVRELDDPELGPIRQVGVVLELEKAPTRLGGPAPKVGEHNAEIRAEAERLAKGPAPLAAAAKVKIKAPLEGLRVLDLGLAIAGPYGTQLLADLGAEVIKTNTPWDSYWHGNHIAFSANRGKKSICLDLKNPQAMAALRELVKTVDVVQHNMRYEAAVRLGVDYESLKQINPRLIYCHTRGHERGPREALPGNDQTGACIAGVQYEDGAIHDGGKPFWSLTSFGDTGNGFLSAVGIMQALYQRERTGEGQFVTTSIVGAQLLNSSYIAARPDGEGFDRPRLDRMMTGTSALYSLYETADGWLAVVAGDEGEWQALCAALKHPALAEARFADAEGRRRHDPELRAELAGVFRARSAQDWWETLDAAGVPCEVADPEAGRRLFQNAELFKRRWIASYKQELVGVFEHAGLGFDLSETPGMIQGPPLVVGEGTRQVLEDIGYTPAQIQALREAGAIATWEPGQPQIIGLRAKPPAKDAEGG